MATLSFDVKDSEAREQLNDLEDYVEHMRTFTRTVLYDSGSYTSGAATQTDIALADSIANYDMLMIVTATATDNTTYSGYVENQFFADTTEITSSNFKRLLLTGYNERVIHLTFPTASTFNIAMASGESQQIPALFKIYGYKF